MTRKDAFSVWYAQYLLSRSTTATGSDLAVAFKHRRIKTDSGGTYVVGARGIFNYLRAAWHRLTNAGLHAEADAIATAFTDANGGYAWR